MFRVGVNVQTGLCQAFQIFFSFADTFQNTCPHQSPLIDTMREAVKFRQAVKSLPLYCNLHTSEIAAQRCLDPIVTVDVALTHPI